MGGFEAETPVSVEPSLKYHPGVFEVLTQTRNPGRGPCMVGSLTGAVSSQRVTEEFEGYLGPVGNRTDSAMAKGSLTARPTSRAGAKAGHSDPVVLYGRAIAQRIKGTPGITRLIPAPRSFISTGGVWHLDVRLITSWGRVVGSQGYGLFAIKCT